jgi:hypothetical protein
MSPPGFVKNQDGRGVDCARPGFTFQQPVEELAWEDQDQNQEEDQQKDQEED